MEKETKKGEETNTMAIIALVASLTGFFYMSMFSIVGFILGVIAMKQIERTGEKGKGLAEASVILGVIAMVVLFFTLI